MTITKKERRIAIGIGIAIGVAFSSMLVRYAFQFKESKMQARPGNYDSLVTAFDGSAFEPLPEKIRMVLPHGLVVHYEANRPILSQTKRVTSKSWVIETSGSFRSERLFVLAEENFEGNVSEIDFYRASELYLKFHQPTDIDPFKLKIDSERFRIIGKNSSSGEWILQIKRFSPSDIVKTINELKREFPELSTIRPVLWVPPR